MNTFIIILLIETALGLLLLWKEKHQHRFLSWLFFLSVAVAVFLTFFVDGATTINQNQNEMLQAVPTGNEFQGFTSTFLSLILLFFIVVFQPTEPFHTLYHAVMGGLLGFVVLHLFFKVIGIPPYLLLYQELSALNIRFLLIAVLIVGTAFLVGFAATVGLARTEQNDFFFAMAQYSVVFSIFLSMALFHRHPDANPTFWPYENMVALLVSLLCGFIFLVLFQRNWKIV